MINIGRATIKIYVEHRISPGAEADAEEHTPSLQHLQLETAGLRNRFCWHLRPLLVPHRGLPDFFSEAIRAEACESLPRPGRVVAIVAGDPFERPRLRPGEFYHPGHSHPQNHVPVSRSTCSYPTMKAQLQALRQGDMKQLTDIYK
jgi:hypothetical protein